MDIPSSLLGLVRRWRACQTQTERRRAERIFAYIAVGHAFEWMFTHGSVMACYRSQAQDRVTVFLSAG
jgi:hypothetical protein